MINTSEKPRLLMIITKGDLGGAQTHLYDLCRHIKEQYDVHVIIGEDGPLYEKLQQISIAVHIIPSLNRYLSSQHDLQAFKEISSLIKQLKPDLVAAHSSKAGILGRISAARLGVPCVFTAHGWAFTEGVSPFKRFVYRTAESWVARRTDRIICVSDYDRNLALNNQVASPEKLVIIHNGISMAEKSNNVKPGKELRLIMVARFCEPKDHKLLLQAVAGINTERAFILQLVGEGPNLVKSQELAQQLGIAHKVEFLGPRRDVPALLQQADIFILSSRWEGFPITILEAMQTGLPVLCSDVGGCKEAVLEGNTGFLVPRGDLLTMQKRLLELIENEPLRLQMGAAGYNRFVDHFTVDKMVEKTRAVYRDVLQKRKP